MLGPLLLVVALGDLGFVGPLNVGLTLLADRRGWGASGVGWVLAGFGIGAGAASLLLAVRGRTPRAGLVLSVTIAGGAGAITALAHVPSVPAAVAAAVVIGLLAGLSGALCGALLQTEADPACLGRVGCVQPGQPGRRAAHHAAGRRRDRRVGNRPGVHGLCRRLRAGGRRRPGVVRGAPRGTLRSQMPSCLLSCRRSMASASPSRSTLAARWRP